MAASNFLPSAASFSQPLHCHAATSLRLMKSLPSFSYVHMLPPHLHTLHSQFVVIYCCSSRPGCLTQRYLPSKVPDEVAHERGRVPSTNKSRVVVTAYMETGTAATDTAYVETGTAATDKVPSADELKAQLEALQSEAEQARARANSARARFMRLTEAAERLRLRAAMDMKAGRESSARQLITEKQKVVTALENSKQRAELLEELSAKLGEVISRKETQLIAALSCAQLKLGVGDDSSVNEAKTVRFVSPREDTSLPMESSEASVAEDKQSGSKGSSGGEITEDSDGWVDDALSDNFDNFHLSSISEGESAKPRSELSLSDGPHTYPRFLTDIDSQLSDIETKLHDFMQVAALILEEPVDGTTNEKVATVNKVLCDIQNIRSRIHKSLYHYKENAVLTDEVVNPSVLEH